MVAYSFNRRFEEPILAGTKCGTIRAIGRRRHARAGETLQLYVGQRTRHCRLLGKAFCTSVDPIVVTVLIAGDAPTIEAIAVENAFHSGRYHAVFHTSQKIDAFARRDGFADGGDMARFWVATHADCCAGGVIRFRGVWIQWAPFGDDHALD